MRKRSMRGGGFAVLLAVAAAVVGCFSPDLGPAACAACEDECPGELVCREGFCVYPGSTISCSSSAEGGDAGEPAGTAGRPHHGGSSGAGGVDGATSGGASGEAGTGTSEGGTAGDGSLQIDFGAPERGCTTRDLSSSWSVVGGTEPYVWTLLQSPPGFVLSATSDHATVEGKPTLPGDQRVRVRVTDATGNVGEREWIVPVLATPTFSTRELPDVCPHELYSQEFTAEGASAGGLTWSVNPEFVEQTGIDFDGSRLTGSFGGAVNETFELTVTVANGSCVADPVELELRALNPGDASCPDLVAPTIHRLLAQPCAGQPYEAELMVEGGSGNYTVEALELPEGLSFDETTQLLAGVVNTGGTATLRVADDNGHTIEQSFAIEPRSSCWLAYLSDETGISRLHLYDPELDRRQVVPENETDGPVLDFAFSPDGRVLAFRSSAGVDTTRLQLVSMTSLHTSPLAFESTTAYAWSEDASTLAVAYDTPNARYLGGVSVAGATPGTDPTITSLTPVEAAVDAELTWFAGSSLGFLSEYRADTVYLGTTSRVPGGFGVPEVSNANSYEGASWLRPGAEGIFLIPPTNFNIVYFSADGSLMVLHDQIPRSIRTISPSGRYLARVTEPNLELFPAEKSSSLTAPADEVQASCDAILAWAQGRETIACATSEDGGRVSLFDVNTAANSLGQRRLVIGNYAIPKGSQTQQWRVFSKSGERFAFAVDGALYMARLDDETARAEPLGTLFPSGASGGAELAFSPNESLLVSHHGDEGLLFPVEPSLFKFQYRPITSSMRPSTRCEEDFTGRTGPYCGAELAAAPYAWSGDSRWLAYQEETGTLKVMDLRGAAIPIFDHVVAGEPCAETCPGGSAFAYQP
jgi:hypothetical protein